MIGKNRNLIVFAHSSFNITFDPVTKLNDRQISLVLFELYGFLMIANTCTSRSCRQGVGRFIIDTGWQYVPHFASPTCFPAMHRVIRWSENRTAGGLTRFH